MPTSWSRMVPTGIGLSTCARYMVNNWLKNIHTLLYPGCCILCGASGTGQRDLCDACLTDLPRNLHACRRCALPLPEAAADQVCGDCHKRPPEYERCLAPLRYLHPVDHLLTRLKFHQKLANARILGELMAQWLEPEAQPELIIPVPLHPSRLRERGYNQALELARPVGKRLGIPIDTHCCRRSRATTAQAGLNARQRRANLRNAFTVTGKPEANHVVIIDDVITTGHTVGELARTLRRAGVKRIDVWACARAPRRR